MAKRNMEQVNELLEFRQALGLGVDEMGAALGVERGTFRKYSYGYRQMDANLWPEIYKMLIDKRLDVQRLESKLKGMWK